MSEMHEAVLIQLHKAHERGEIPYRVWCDEPIHLGPPGWSWIVVEQLEAIAEPDLSFQDQAGEWFLAIYIDGYYHIKRKARDDEIDERLEAAGIEVERLLYKRFSKGRAKKFSKKCIEVVKDHG